MPVINQVPRTGGGKWELLWTNSSPNSAFSPRTLNIDFTPYEYFVVECKLSTTSNGSQYNVVLVNATEKYLSMACGGTYDVRNCTFTTSSITIPNAQWSPSATVNNEHIIPLNIYGVKKLNLG